MTTCTSPVPPPSPDAAPAEIHRGFYGMPMFCIVPTRDLDASRDFWIEGLGFIDLFTAPGQMTHLRHWAFQDVLLPAEGPGTVGAVGAVDEAGERWGDSDQWAQYAARTAEFTTKEWREVAARTHALHADLAAAQTAGTPPGSPEANALAEAHRALLSTCFDTTHAMHACMGRMFTDDPRFADRYDALSPGLARWLRETLFANARAHGVDPHTATWE